MSYQAFLSYSHAADDQLAPALQSALQRFAKPWYRRRALRIFRDKTSLSANPALWPAIERALVEAEHLLLLASPEAASSPWVAREVAWWLEHRSGDTLLVVLTGGDLAWDPAAGDFDWQRTSALAASLRGRFPEEPLYVDLRWAKASTDLSLRHSLFRAAILDLAAPLHGRPKDELDGEDVRQHRRTRAVTAAALLAILALAGAAGYEALLAIRQRDEAVRQRGIAVQAQGFAQEQQRHAERERDRAERAAVAERQAREAEARQRQIAEDKRREAEREKNLAVARQLATQSDLLATKAAQTVDLLELRALLAAESLRRSPDFEDRHAVDTSLDGLPARTVRLAYAPTGYEKITFSADGRRLAVAQEKTVWVFDPASGAVVLRVPLPEAIESLALSPDGRRLAVGAFQGSALIVDTSTGARLATISTPRLVKALAWSPDGQHLVLGTYDGTVQLSATSSGGVLWSVRQKATVQVLAFSPDGRLVVASCEDATSHLLDAANGHEIGALAGTAPVQGIAFHPFGKLAATANGSGTVGLFKMPEGTKKDEIPEPPPADFAAAGSHDGVTVAFSRDGTYLATTGGSGTVRIFDLHGGGLGLAAPARRWDHQGYLVALAFAGDGRLLAANEKGRVLAFEPGLALPLGLAGEVLSEDGSALVSGMDWKATLYATATGERRFQHPDIEPLVALSADGRILAAPERYGRGRVRVFALPGGAESPAILAAGEVQALILSGDGGRLALRTEDGLVQLFATATGRELARWPGLPQGPLALSRDGRSLARAEAAGVRIVDLASGREATWRGSGAVPGTTVTVLAWSRDGRSVAVGMADGAVRILDRTTLSARAGLFANGVAALAWSPDGRHLAAGGGDGHRVGEVHVFETATGRQVARLVSSVAVSALAFGPGGSLVTLAEEHVEHRLWRSADLVEEACSRLTRNLTREEWRQYLGGEAYLKTCPGLP